MVFGLINNGGRSRELKGCGTFFDELCLLMTGFDRGQRVAEIRSTKHYPPTSRLRRTRILNNIEFQKVQFSKQKTPNPVSSKQRQSVLIRVQNDLYLKFSVNSVCSAAGLFLDRIMVGRAATLRHRLDLSMVPPEFASRFQGILDHKTV
jgi:hypothetical protein